MENKIFYRVSNLESEQGLWYDFKGNFTGLIHTEFDFCTNSQLRMDYDNNLRGFLSSVETIDSLYQWFTKEEILRLQSNGYFIHEFESKDYWFYEPFQHWVISQNSSILTKRIILF
jgi:hypothetical protein